MYGLQICIFSPSVVESEGSYNRIEMKDLLMKLTNEGCIVKLLRSSTTNIIDV